MPEVQPDIETFARIKVIGVGGAGGAAVNRMIEAGITGVDFVAVNTDAQALHYSKAPEKLHIGKTVTKGLGAGADPTTGLAAAEESIEEIRQLFTGADMVFVTIGAGGGTGSGAGPVVARAAKDQGILVVGIATRPFAFEGEKRRKNANDAIATLSESVDTLITIPNDKLLQTIDRRTPLLDAFKVADDVLRQGVQGISDLITVHGVINLDFADVKTVMSNAGSALMGIGRASGEQRAVEAAQMAIDSPLLEVSVDGARGVLFNITGGQSMSMHEINEAAETITAAVDPDANIIFGATMNNNVDEEIIVTVIAAGFDDDYYETRAKEVEVSDVVTNISGIGDDDIGRVELDDEFTEEKVREVEAPAPVRQEPEPVQPEPVVAEAPREPVFEHQVERVEAPAPESKSSSIWSYDEETEEELETPAFFRRLKKKNNNKD